MVSKARPVNNMIHVAPGAIGLVNPRASVPRGYEVNWLVYTIWEKHLDSNELSPTHQGKALLQEAKVSPRRQRLFQLSALLCYNWDVNPSRGRMDPSVIPSLV